MHKEVERMKQQVNPAVFASIIVVAVLILGFFAWRTWMAPSSTVSPEAVPKGAQSPRAGGGPDAAALKQRDEYNRTHPGAAGSR
jgi:hypothetical protein